jgi:GntR family transcriptional regulator, transcriptional repressor for pyruvate dehydrogenase complex
MIPALVPDRLSDRLAALLAAQIEGGGLKPGDRLPTEAQLAATYKVSRSVVREAVHQLRSRALVISRQGAGVFVAPPPLHRPLDFDPTVLESLDAVLQVLELRRVLEGEMAALAAERATRAQVAGLRRALRAIEQAPAQGRLGVEEDFAFHRAIGEATHNPQFVRLLAFIEQYLLEGMRVTKGNDARRDEWMQQVHDEHLAIVEAIAARDAEAARRAAIRHHLGGAARLEQGGVVQRAQGARRVGAATQGTGGGKDARGTRDTRGTRTTRT